MKRISHSFLPSLLLALNFCASAAWAQSGSYIHGSWVNVRSQADASSRVLDQLHTNQSIEISERQGAWCKVAYGAGKSGFVQCSLTGSQPLTLQQAAKEPARAFWIAPSSKRLRDYGNSLKPPAHLTLEALRKTKKAGEEIKYPAVPEFEAAKRLMRAGVLLKPENEIRREIADLSKELAGLGMSAPEAKPSLFKTQGSVVLAHENDADGFAAVAGSRLSVTPISQPTGQHDRHSGPEIEWITGFWDVGDADFQFTPGVVIYNIASTALISATRVTRTAMHGQNNVARSCGDSTSPFFMAYGYEYGGGRFMAESIKGYPKLNDSQLFLFGFSAKEIIAPNAAKIQFRTINIPAQKLKLEEQDLKDALERKLAFKASTWAIDLNNDGHADIFMLERPLKPGVASAVIVNLRKWFVNINGQWFKAGELADEDCT